MTKAEKKIIWKTYCRATEHYFEQQQEMHQHIKETMEPFFGFYESLKNIFEGGNNK